MNQYTSMRSELSKARNLGSSGHGSHHWLMQRLSAVLMIPLFMWLVYFVATISGMSERAILEELKLPYNLTPLLLLMLSSLYHSMLGMQVVIEDYIGTICVRNFLIIGLKLFTFLTMFFLFVASIFFVFIAR